MPHSKLYNTLILRYFSNKELDRLYISFFLKALAQSMILIFIPIYLLTLGYVMREVSLYFITSFAVLAISFLPGQWASSRIGLKKTMALGTFTLIPFYYFLHELRFGGSFYISATLFGIATGVFYSAFNIEFAESSAKKFEASNLSMMRAVAIASTALGPIVGALIISKYSFDVLFITVSTILVLSVIPLFLTKDRKVELGKVSPKAIFKADTPRRAIAHQTAGATVALSFVFWPIFIYLILNDLVLLGLIGALSQLFLVFAVLYLGKASDDNPKKTLKYGVYAHSGSWVMRLIFLTPLGFLFSGVFSSISNFAIDLSFGKMIYSKAKEAKNIANYFLFREYHLNLGRILVLVAAALTQSIFWMFVAAAFITFGYMVLMKE